MADPIIDMKVLVNTKPADNVFKRLMQRAGDLRGWFFDFLDPEVTKFYKKQFSTRGRHGGGRPWASLSPLTIQLRRGRGRSLGGSNAILRDTDGMYKRFVHSGGLGFRVVTKDEYRRGVIDGVAWRHQDGWVSRSIFGIPRKVPKRVEPRPIVPDEMPERVIGFWQKGLADWIEDA